MLCWACSPVCRSVYLCLSLFTCVWVFLPVWVCLPVFESGHPVLGLLWFVGHYQCGGGVRAAMFVSGLHQVCSCVFPLDVRDLQDMFSCSLILEDLVAATVFELVPFPFGPLDFWLWFTFNFTSKYGSISWKCYKLSQFIDLKDYLQWKLWSNVSPTPSLWIMCRYQ